MLTRCCPARPPAGTACADTFVTTIGPKLYRRPLTAAEKARYLAFFDKTGKEDFKSFVYWTTSTMLQSPNVIYRSELGEPDGNRFKLTPYEVASQLSYTFTGGPPSDRADAAGGGQQARHRRRGRGRRAQPGVRRRRRCAPAFREIVLRFTDQWLGLSRLFNVKKDAMLYPEFNAQIQDSMAEETRRFISSVIFDEKGSVASLLTAPYTFVDATPGQVLRLRRGAPAPSSCG